MNRTKKIGRILIKIFGAALSVAAMAGLYLALILARPTPEAEADKSPQPLLTASPRKEITSEGEMRELAATFPAPVMSFMSGSGMVFVSGNAEDAAWQGMYGRILTLYWQTREGEPLILQSIYPGEALELMGKGDYAFSGTAGPTLFGLASVRMENAETIRIHVQIEDEAVYVLTVPKTLGSALSGISRSIQLFTAE